MVELRAYDPFMEDPKYDNCGSTTMAVLKVGSISIPLCEECLGSLTEDLNKYNSTIFCHQCQHWIPNQYGWNYTGLCKKKAEKDNHEIKDSDVGYMYGSSFMETCNEAERKGDANE